MGFLYFLLALVLFLFLWPWIRRWLQRRMQRKMEQMLRRAMGLPPEEKPAKKKRKGPKTSWKGSSRKEDKRAGDRKIPPEYGVDVEYTEIKEYTSKTTVDISPGEVRYKEERQVEDAEWVEIQEKDKR